MKISSKSKRWTGEPDTGFSRLTATEQAEYRFFVQMAQPDDTPSNLVSRVRDGFPGRWVYRGGCHIAVHLGRTYEAAGECAFRLLLI